MIYRVNVRKIKDLRLKKGYSQEEFAELIGIVVSSVRCMESGSKTPSAGLLKKIAVVLDCAMDDLVYEDTQGVLSSQQGQPGAGE